MTTPPDVSDATLERYVLGDLPADETERLDELSVVDNAFAERLEALEADLADAYARGELPASDRERWEMRHLASDDGRTDLRLAHALADHERRRASARTSGRWRPALAVAAAAILVAGMSVVLLQRRTAERHEIVPPQAQSAPATSPVIVALTLAPPMRSATVWTALLVPRTASIVRLRLQLEPNDFSSYDVVVRDAQTGTAQWRMDGVLPEGTPAGRVLSIDVPAAVFHRGRYLIDTAGVRGAHSEVVGTYTLDAVLQ